MKTPTRIDMEDFKTILNDEIKVYNTMEKRLAQKKQVVVQGNLDELAKLDTELEQLTQRARDLEKERLAIMIRMGREGETLKEFIGSLQSGEDETILRQVQDKLVATTTEIRELSRTNRDLLTQSIRFVEQSVEVIAAMLAPEGAAYSNLRGSRTIGREITGTESASNTSILPSSTISTSG